MSVSVSLLDTQDDQAVVPLVNYSFECVIETEKGSVQNKILSKANKEGTALKATVMQKASRPDQQDKVVVENLPVTDENRVFVDFSGYPNENYYIKVEHPDDNNFVMSRDFNNLNRNPSARRTINERTTAARFTSENVEQHDSFDVAQEISETATELTEEETISQPEESKSGAPVTIAQDGEDHQETSPADDTTKEEPEENDAQPAEVLTLDSQVSGILDQTLKVEITRFGDSNDFTTTVNFDGNEKLLVRSDSLSNDNLISLFVQSPEFKTVDGFNSLEFNPPLPPGAVVRVYDMNNPNSAVSTSIAGE